MTAIQAEKIVKCYKEVRALDGVSLNVEEGELFGLLGVNGAGKTTLIKILTGLVTPDSGGATLCGLPLGEEGIKKIVDVSPQETAVAPNLTVKENLLFFANVYGRKGKEAEERVGEIVEQFGLEEVLSRRAGKLSGGWQRRLSIAMGLISSPKILFLDEPTLGLDVLARRELWRCIKQLKGSVTIVLTSHYLEEIEALCDRVAVMSKGKIRAIGAPEELKKSTGKESFEDAFIEIVEGKV